MGCGTSKVLPADPSSPRPAVAEGGEGGRRAGPPIPPTAANAGPSADANRTPPDNSRYGDPASPLAPAVASGETEPGPNTGPSLNATTRAPDSNPVPATTTPPPVPETAAPLPASAQSVGPAVLLRPDLPPDDGGGDGRGAAKSAAVASAAVATSPAAPDAGIVIAPPAIIDDGPLAVVSKGVSLRGLRRLRQRLIAFFGGEDEYTSLTTEDVNTRWVQVVTRGSRCRVAEDPSLLAPEDVGLPDYFISHAWKNRFDLLLASVEAFLTSADEETRVWIDILAVNQHPSMPHQARDVAAFKDVVRASSAGTLVVLDLANINPATRAWCIYEWAATLALHGPEGLHLRVGPQGRATLASSLDVTKAECYNASDKDMILADVVSQHGSTDAFNTKLKLQLLLEPLSYAVDVRRLAERAAGTTWRFGPVQEWLRAGATRAWGSSDVEQDRGRGCGNDDGEGDEGSVAKKGTVGEQPMPPRALVVVGGAGEGKSTVSAVLVGGGLGSGAGSLGNGWGVKRVAEATGAGEDSASGGGGGGGGAAGCVDAFHFLKYNDQRRLDPVRIIRSLAFQLAGRFPVVAEHLLKARPGEVINPRNVESAAYTLLDQPLKDLLAESRGSRTTTQQRTSQTQTATQAQQPRQVVILVDALDEAEPPPPPEAAAGAGAANGAGSGGSAAAATIPCGNKAFQLIVKQLAGLPPHVRFIFTTRPDAVGGSVVPALQRAFAEHGGVTLLRPGELREPAPAAASDAENTADVDGGVMVFHTVASKCLAAAGAAAATSKKARPSLTDLYDLYGTVFRRAWASYDAREAGGVQRLLEAVLAAQEPLPQSRLQALGLARLPARLPGWPVMFSVEEHHLYTLHKSLADWMTRRDDGGNGGGGGQGGFLEFSTANGHLQLARQLASERATALAAAAATAANKVKKSGGDGGGGDGGGVGGASAISPYCYKYLVRHLVMAAAAAPPGSAVRTEAAELLTTVLYDFDFMAGAFREGQGYGLIEDLATARDQPPDVYDALRWLLSKQHELGPAREVGQLLTTAVLCPSGTAAFRRACEAYTAIQAAQGRPGYRLLGQVGGPDVSWPALKSTLQGYKYAFTGVAFSPDGRVVANTSAAKEGFVRVWDARSGAELTRIEPKRREEYDGGTYDLTSILFSPDGRTMVAGSSAYGRIFLYDVMTGEEIGSIAAHGYLVSSISFLELDGETVLVSGGRDDTARIWRHRPQGAAAAAAAAAAAVAAGEAEAAEARAQQRPRRRVTVSKGAGLEWQCCAVLQHPEMSGVVTLAAGRGSRAVSGGASGASERSGPVIVTGGGDGVVRVWERRQPHGGCHSGDGGDNGGGSGDGEQMGAVGDGGWRLTAELKGKTRYIEGVALSPGCETIASTDDEVIRLWRRGRRSRSGGEAPGIAATGEDGSGGGRSGAGDAPWQCVAVLRGHSTKYRCVMFTTLHGLTVLASGGWGAEYTVQLWVRCATAVIPGGGGGGGGVEQGAAVAEAATTTAPKSAHTGSGGKRVDDDVGDDEWRRAVVLRGHARDVLCLAANPANPLSLASSGQDGSVRLWNLRPQEMRDLENAAAGEMAGVAGVEGGAPAEDQAVMSVALSFDHEWLAAASDAVIKMWRRQTQGGGGGQGGGGAGTGAGGEGGGWVAAGELKEPGVKMVLCVAFSAPDAQGRTWLASGGDDAKVRLWLHDGAAVAAGGGGWSCAAVLGPPSPVGRQALYAIYSVCFGSGGGGGGDVGGGVSGGGGRPGFQPLVLAASGLGAVRAWAQAATEDSSRWESMSVERLASGDGRVEIVDKVAARADGRALVGATDEGVVWIWTRSKSMPSPRPTSASAVAAATGEGGDEGHSPPANGSSCSYCWQLTTTLNTQRSNLRSLAWSPNGRWLALSDHSQDTHVWYRPTADAATGDDDDGNGAGGGGKGDEGAAVLAADACGQEDGGGSDSSDEYEDTSSDEDEPTVGDGGWVMVCSLKQPNRAWSLSFSADGRTLAVTSGDQRREEKLVRLFRMAPLPRKIAAARRLVAAGVPAFWQPVLDLRGHPDAVMALAFSPSDPAALATGCCDGGTRVWQLLEPETAQGAVVSEAAV